MAQTPMPELESTTQGHVLVVKPSGRLDHGVSAGFETGLIEQTQKAIATASHIVIDLQSVNFVSSIILKVIRSQKELLAEHGLKLALCSPSPVVREILQITQFHFVAGMHDCVADAAVAVAQSN